MDLFDACEQFTTARAAMAADLYPYFLTLDGSEGTTARYRGQDLIMCGSNNYLGLTADHRVREASISAIDRYGTSCTGSRLLNGNLRLHEELEGELAAFLGKEAALVFSTGYQANLGAIGGLVSSRDVVLIDQRAHASIIDACRLSQARVLKFRHNDCAHLDRRLARLASDVGKLVVVDGVYSMEGDICPLPDLVAICQQHGARLIVDDAHGLGVLGDGRGTAASFGLAAEVDLITVTFSKALAAIGGAVVGSEQVIHYLRHHARSLIFSASITPANAAAALAALRIVRDEPWRCHQALANGALVRGALTELDFSVGSSETPIVPIMTENELSTLLLWRGLLEAGVYTNAIVPPAASPRLRTSFMATHTPTQLSAFVDSLVFTREQLRDTHEHAFGATG